MKEPQKKTLWKRATSEKHSRTEFDNIVQTLSAYVNSNLKGTPDEVLAVLEQLEKASAGKTKELFNAVRNVLENLKLELVVPRSGVATVLRDVSTFLVKSKTAAALENESARLDEMLERLDFVASGGTDEEVPRAQTTDAASEPVRYIPKFPIKLPKQFEDPKVMNVVERLESLNILLSGPMHGNIETDQKQKLVLEQLSLANYCLHTVKANTKTDFEMFAAQLVTEISESLATNSGKPVEFVQYEVSKGAIYRSLAEVFRWKLRDVATTIGAELVTSKNAKIQLEFACRESYIFATIHFTGLRTAIDLISQRIDDLSMKVEHSPITEHDESKKTSLSSTAKTRKERIAQNLVEFRQFVDKAHGTFRIAGDDNDQLTVTVQIPVDARVLHTFPITIGSDLYLIESHFLSIALDSNEAQWNESQTSIEYADHNYQRCWIDEDIKPSSDIPTWFLLLDTQEQKLALEVETIQEPEFQIFVPSVSGIHHGHRSFGEGKLKLLLDPTELHLDRNNGKSSDCVDLGDRHYLCLNVSILLEDKIRRCADSNEIVVRHAQSIAETLSQLQEYRPEYLIIEDHPNEFRAVDAVARLAHAMPALKVPVLIFVEDHFEPLTPMKNTSFKATCFGRDVDFGRLKKVLVADSDSAVSVSE